MSANWPASGRDFSRARSLGFEWGRQGERESRSPRRGPGDFQFSAHLLDELARNGESEPGAAMTAGRRAVALLEFLEDRLARGGGNARTGVLDLEAQTPGVGRADAHADTAFFGEIHGVAREIDQHLPQPRGVADHAPRRVLRRRNWRSPTPSPARAARAVRPRFRPAAPARRARRAVRACRPRSWKNPICRR